MANGFVFPSVFVYLVQQEEESGQHQPWSLSPPSISLPLTLSPAHFSFLHVSRLARIAFNRLYSFLAFLFFLPWGFKVQKSALHWRHGLQFQLQLQFQFRPAIKLSKYKAHMKKIHSDRWDTHKYIHCIYICIINNGEQEKQQKHRATKNNKTTKQHSLGECQSKVQLAFRRLGSKVQCSRVFCSQPVIVSPPRRALPPRAYNGCLYRKKERAPVSFGSHFGLFLAAPLCLPLPRALP